MTRQNIGVPHGPLTTRLAPSCRALLGPADEDQCTTGEHLNEVKADTAPAEERTDPARVVEVIPGAFAAWESSGRAWPPALMQVMKKSTERGC